MNTLPNGLPRTVSTYLQATNQGDRAAFIGCFDVGALVDDAGREFRGVDAIRDWSEREIFGASVSLEVLAVASQGDDVVVTTQVEGTFDRTGLPDPVIIDHRLRLEGDRIQSLTCRLSDRKSGVPG